MSQNDFRVSEIIPHSRRGGVPVTGTSCPSGQTGRPRSYPPKSEGAAGLPRWTTKATPAATLALIIGFFVLKQKILWYPLNNSGTRYRDTTQIFELAVVGRLFHAGSMISFP